MKKTFNWVIVLSFLLTGCLEQDPNPEIYKKNKQPYQIVCLNGVKYYQSGYVLAPVVNAKTLTYETCDPAKVGY